MYNEATNKQTGSDNYQQTPKLKLWSIFSNNEDLEKQENRWFTNHKHPNSINQA